MREVSDKADHYDVFGLSRRLGLDRDELESEFLRLSREFHPDRFAGAPAAERAEIQRNSARVNDAYRTLRDPVSRAEYLLLLEGIERPEGEAKCPPDLLEEVFEPAFLDANGITRIATYETGGSEGGAVPIESPLDEGIREKLRSLGYIE